MNKKHIAILGAGIIGAAALILIRPTPTYETGGASGGGSKKEEVSTGETVTETPITSDPIYNIFFPDPSFPDIPQAPITEPWWVKSLDPPTPTPSYMPVQTVKEILAPVTADPPAPRVIPTSKKEEASKKIISRGPSTGIAILDKIQWR